jgi:iron complex outermembrane receptor protein
LNLNIGWQQNQRQEFSNPENLNERALFFDLKTLTYTSQFIFMEKNGWKNSIGINGMSQKNTNLGIEQIIPNYLLFDIGGNIFTQKEFKKLTISGGVRLDNRVLNASSLMDSSFTKGEAFKKQFSNFSGSIGLTFPLHKTLDLKANIARAFRAPSIPELASNGAHEGTNRYEYGDIYLKSEISTQADISLEWNKEHFSLNLAGYYNHFSNFIYYRKLQSLNGNDSLVQSNGQSYLAFKFDQQKVNMAGFEFSLDVHPHPLDWLHFENTFSYVRGLFTSAIEGTKNLSFVPAPQLITQIKADRKKIGKVFKNGYALLEIQNTFSQNNIFTAYHTETITPGYCLVNAGFGAEILSKKNIQLLGIYFSANNITDVAYQNHLSRLKYTAENLATGRVGVFNMGRNFSLKINVPLSFKI